MLTYNQGTFAECLDAFLHGDYKYALFVVKDHNRFRELTISCQGVVRQRDASITFDDGRKVKFFTHREDKFNVSGCSYQYLAVIDYGLEFDKLIYLISRLRVVGV